MGEVTLECRLGCSLSPWRSSHAAQVRSRAAAGTSFMTAVKVPAKSSPDRRKKSRDAVPRLDTSKNRWRLGDFGDSLLLSAGERRMAGQPGFFDLDERYRALSAAGDRAGAAGAGGRLRAVPARARGGAAAVGPGQGRAAALRRGADVQGAGAADALHAVGRPDRVPAARPALVHALRRAWRCTTRCRMPRRSGCSASS